MSMKHRISSAWKGGMRFDALVNGHTITMDAPERAGGNNSGPIPKPFVLTALSGCTGMDVAKYLCQGDHTISDLNITVSGTITDKPPITYTTIRVEYAAKGPVECAEHLLAAVQDSLVHTCGVADMIKRIMPLEWVVRYNDVELAQGKLGQSEPLRALSDISAV